MRVYSSLFGQLVIFTCLLGPFHAYAAPTWPELENASEIKSQRNGSGDAAVIVAIEKYETLPAVTGARLNAAAWYRYLVESVGVRRERVSALADGDAEDYSIRRALEARAAEVKEGSRLWFIFIGHGAPAELEAARIPDGWLVGYSAKPTVEGIAARSVRRSEMLRTLAFSAGESVVILDACFSGIAPGGSQLVPGLQPLSVVGGGEPEKVLLLTAASAGEFAGPLPGANRPAFSYLLLGALRGWGDADQDGNVSGDEAIWYVKDVLATVLHGTRSQRPTIAGATRAGILAQGRERGPKLERNNPFAPGSLSTPSAPISATAPLAAPSSYVPPRTGPPAQTRNFPPPRAFDGYPVQQQPYESSPDRPTWDTPASGDAGAAVRLQLQVESPQLRFQLPPRPVWHGRTIK